VDENVKVGSSLPNPCAAAGPSFDCRKAPKSVVREVLEFIIMLYMRALNSDVSF
jgi:hypothetical protein